MTKFVVTVAPSSDGAVRVYEQTYHVARDEWTRLPRTEEIEPGQETEFEVDGGGLSQGKPRSAKRVVIEEV